MLSRKFWFVVIGMLIVVVSASAIYISQNAPEVSNVVVSDVECISLDNDVCARFPAISGDSLTGQTYMLPDDFEGIYTLVVMPFDREQQARAQTWLPYAQALSEQYPDMKYYNVPLFPDLPAPVRLLARSGLIALMNEQEQSITITVFLADRDVFLEAVEIPDVEEIQTFLLNSTGEIVWRSSGEFSTDKGAELSGLFETLHTDG